MTPHEGEFARDLRPERRKIDSHAPRRPTQRFGYTAPRPPNSVRGSSRKICPTAAPPAEALGR
jgi:hypothetical protein